MRLKKRPPDTAAIDSSFVIPTDANNDTYAPMLRTDNLDIFPAGNHEVTPTEQEQQRHCKEWLDVIVQSSQNMYTGHFIYRSQLPPKTDILREEASEPYKKQIL